MKTRFIATALAGGALALSLGGAVQTADASQGAEIIRKSCLGCHTETDGRFSRISDQRKTPEGWLMTLVRMQMVHGVELAADDRRALVKYLADTQGLAPAETAGARYALERRLDTPEAFESQAFTEMCARCHSGARVMLQRRPAEEWEHLVHFHLGQWPTTEYQALARDRDWFELALNEMVPELAATQPLTTEAWEQWRKRPAAEVAGTWTVAGQLPGRGAFSGAMTVEPGGTRDEYRIALTGAYADGTALTGQGTALIYTGFEWRGSLDVDGTAMRQVFALEDGRLVGRMFERDHDEIGADVVAARHGEGAHILAVQPEFLRAGEEAELTIVGAGLEGEPQLPDGIALVSVVERSPSRVVLRARAETAALGVHTLKVGAAEGGSLAVFERVAALRVVPEYTVARVGGNGGSTPPVQARFQAEAWAAGADGVAGTEDDYRIGFMPANWSVAPFDEVAEADGDARFAGVMEAKSGIFMPAAAGPNPARRMGTNNAGNLRVLAELDDGGQVLTGEGQMIVTVQRWNNPPIP
ncbi:MAG: quinohemoprotein amine dehydrogenase subunit alpha [Rhodocyclaceae bacterium]